MRVFPTAPLSTFLVALDSTSHKLQMGRPPIQRERLKHCRRFRLLVAEGECTSVSCLLGRSQQRRQTYSKKALRRLTRTFHGDVTVITQGMCFRSLDLRISFGYYITCIDRIPGILPLTLDIYTWRADNLYIGTTWCCLETLLL